ncbi:acetyl-CoA synthetase-like protein [Annulohypoxylon maeteangense]|uniref:acetyl-CoA synthetase-like protein n=1 Tax=Annulohypoxylon maeteangense TaxID=1927788 RepID=UPI0020081D63|nr:acetyl-CoA synthetase-like protein [Annulohypoxylon maeteangense]KAI0883623.1 acetyl-CoA synthetase-like protein [Annulohypoxylon maeteangense]
MNNPVEQLLLQLYAEVLSIPEDRISLEESFIALGGDSFKAIKLKRKCDRLGIRLALRDIFARKTITTIAAGQRLMDDRPKRSQKKEKKVQATGVHGRYPMMPQGYSWDTILEELDLQGRSFEALNDIVENIYPCSPMQESIYVAKETRGKHLYRIHALFEIGSSITIDVLESSWQSIIDRHETLRTVFVPSTDISSSRILDAVVFKTARCNLERIECKNYADVFAFYQGNCIDPQDFPKGPPHRLTTYRIEDGRCFCVFEQSHMISDGTSLINTVTELCALAGGSILDVAPGYSGFIKHRQAEIHLDEGLDYWKSYLRGSQPCNFPSLWVDSSLMAPRAQARCHVVEFPFLRHKELGEFCAKLETTVSTTLQAAWALLLRAYTGNDDIYFGYTCSGRDLPLDGVEMICGPLVNLVIRKVILANRSIRDMIETIQSDFANSLPFQEVPFMRVQQLLEATETKLFNTIMTIQYAPLLVDENDDFPLKLMNNFNASDFGLSVQVMYSDIATKMQLTYSTNLLSATMAERVTETFVSIIENLINTDNLDSPVGQLEVICPSDKQQTMEWNQETLDIPLFPDSTVHGLIEETATCTPGAPAIYFSGETFSYDDLNSMSTHLALQMLKSLGREQCFVPLFFEKSALYSISLLAVLKCGRAFVPIDISNPLSRIQRLLEQLGITRSSGLIVCSVNQSEKLLSAYRHILVPSIRGLRDEVTKATGDNSLAPFPMVQPSDPAYVIFTSGSTGDPKGVVVSHGSYAHAARAHAGGISIGTQSRVLQFASYAFDTSMEDHLTSFSAGACLCVPTEPERETALAEFINQSGVNWVHITPSMVDMISPNTVPLLTTVVLGGEPMTGRNVVEWAIPGRHLIQVYGPSECSVTSTINPDVSVHRDATNIGKTFGGCATWITDPNDPNSLCPIGAIGELLMEGPILAQGYLRRASGTESVFITGVSWAPEKRLYRTGDMVQYDKHGNLHFVGRADSRVKIRGQRIECGEIESQLLTQSSVLHAVVVVPKSGPGAGRLIATVSLKSSEEKSHREHTQSDIQVAALEPKNVAEFAKALHNWLGDRLPAYMLPDLFIFVRHIPMNSSRKLDRKRVIRYLEHLREESYRDIVSQMDGPNQDRGGTELECSLKRIWCHVLNVSESTVDWNTSWFSSGKSQDIYSLLGGDSISAMMLSSELRKQAISVAAADILRLRSIERIAAHIQGTVSNDLNADFRDINLMKTTTDMSWELSPIQQLSFQFAPNADYLDQQTMIVDTVLNLSDDTIIAALDALVTAHPMLLARFARESFEGNSVWTQRVASTPPAGSSFTIRFHRGGSTVVKLGRIAETKLAINVAEGPIMGVDVFRSTSSTTISVSIHHLVVDMVSWRTIFQDLEDFVKGEHLIQPEPISFQAWCKVQHIYSQGIQQSQVLPEDRFQVNLEYWAMEKVPNLFGDAVATSFNIERPDMARLLDLCDKLEYDQVDVVCAAIIGSFSEIFQARTSPAVFVEGHGRESPSNAIDLSRTVGWFTTLTPVAIKVPDNKERNTRMMILERIKRFREDTPSKGLDYFTSRFFQKEGIDAYREHHASAEIIMNFLGAYQQFERRNSVFKRCDDSELISSLSAMRREQRKISERYALITIVAVVEDGALSVEVEWNRKMNFQNELSLWPLKIKENLLLLIEDLTLPSTSPHKGISVTRPELTCFGVDKKKVLAKVTSLGLPVHDIEGMYPCSPMQEGLMASLLRDSDTSSAYNQTFLLKFAPAGGRAAESAQLKDIWLRIVRKHAILRTIFVENDAGDYVQVVLRHTNPVVLIKGNVDQDQLRGTLFESENQLLKSPLDGVPLHRLVVCETADKSTYILLTKSHLLTDGMSTQILMRDFVNGYDGVVEAYWDPQNCYRDYIRYVSSQDAEQTRSYWAAYLTGAATCNFPKLRHTDEPEAVVASPRSSVSLQLHGLGIDLRQLCRSHDLTASNIFQLAWVLTLRIYLNSESILFGYLSSGRDLPIAGIQEAVGPVANMLPIRSELRRDMKAIDVAKSLQADYIEHLSRQTLSLTQIRHAARYNNQSPNFNTILNIQKSETGGLRPKKELSQVELVKAADTTEYGLALTITDSEGEYALSLEYDTSLVSSQQADGIVSAFANAMRSVVANPDCPVAGISLVGDGDLKQVRRWDINELQTRNECVHNLFQITARNIPGNEAIHAWDGSLTYGELDVLTNNVARRLIDLSIQPEEIVPLCFEKSIWGIVAMLGVTKAGAAFVHLDPSSPLSRKQKIIELTAPRVAITSSRNQVMMESLVSQVLTVSNEALPSYGVEIGEVKCEIPDRRANPCNALYVIFTSGSTGEPKGVVVEHRNYCSAMAANTTWLQILPSSRVLQFSSFVFDASMEEIFTALVAGACVCVPSDDHRMSPEELSSFMQCARVNWAALTPSLLQTLNPDKLIPPLKFITVHAEPMNASLTKLWSPRVHMRPSYGPTECTVTSTVGSAFNEFSDSSNIGWPVGCHGRVTDPHDPQQLVPIGAVGELVLEGPILCRGYLNRLAETEKAFPSIQDWFDGTRKRVYRTGDLVRYAEDGSLRILGRRDTQIKVRGQRVELREVESQLELSPSVRHGLILQPKSGLLQGRLVAVLSLTRSFQTVPSTISHGDTIQLLNNSATLSKVDQSTVSELLNRILSFISAKLPSYMIPHTWCVMENMPILPSCKLDRKLVSNWLETIDEPTLLLARQFMRSSRSSGSSISSSAEKLVRDAWSEVLAIPRDIIDADDHFIALGGDSISAMNVSRFLNQAGVPIKTQDVLRSNSIRELASVLPSRQQQDSIPVKAQTMVPGSGFARLPSVEDVMSEYGSDSTNDSKILSIIPITPFQLRTTSALYTSSQRPYLYNLVAEISGYELFEQNLDPHRLLEAWRATVARHDILHTAMVLEREGNDAYQVILDESAAACELYEVATEQDALNASIEKTKQIKTSLTKPSLRPLLWLTIFTTPTKRVYVHLLMGHMLIDHVSLSHVLHDWDTSYRGHTLPRNPSQFRTYVHDIESRDSQASTDFWTQRLYGVEPTILPPTHELPQGDSILVEGLSTISFKVAIDGSMHQYCREMRVTISTLLQFAWAVLLGAHTGQESVCFGHLTSDRDIDINDVDEIVGPMLSILVTHVVLRNRGSSVSFVSETIQKLQHENTTSMTHKVFNLSTIEHQLNLQPPTSMLFNTLFNYRKVKRSGPKPVMNLRPILKQDPHEQQIIISFNEVGDADSLDAALTYYGGIHSAGSVQQMAKSYTKIIASLIDRECESVEQLLDHVSDKKATFFAV